MRSHRVMLTAAVVLMLAAVPASTAGGQDEPSCPDTSGLVVPGAEFQQVNCLADLTTLSNQRIDVYTHSWGGSGQRSSPSLNSPATELSDVPVPGLQIEGWFPDSCSHYEIEHNAFIPACPDGHRHNGQFVIRVPNDWDGVHLVVAGTPGVRTQFTSDIILSDYVLSKGWAYVAQDKGNTGLNFFRGGDDEIGEDPLRWIPPEAIRQWADYMGLAAVAGQGTLSQLMGSEASLVYAAGISNGGYQTRLAVERFPEMFDGAVDWEGTLFTVEGPNVYTYIPPLLRGYPSYAASGDADGYREVVHGGTMPPDAEPIWADMYAIYWGSVASTFRPVVDPEYTEWVAGAQLIVPPQHPDAQYDYPSRPEVVRERVGMLANTGDIGDAKMITVHGTLDALLPIASTADAYADLVRAAGHDEDYRYYVVEGGTHLDNDADQFPELFRPILPCFWASIDALDAWVTGGDAAPPSGFVPFPEGTTHVERANSCQLPERIDRVAGADRIATAAAASQRTFGVTEHVVIASATDFAGPLVAAPLAAGTSSPVLLVGSELSDPVIRELDRTGAISATVIGDTQAVSEEVVAALEARGMAVERIAGDSPAALSAAVAAQVGAPEGVAYVASAESFADTLSASAVAAGLRAPLLLTDPAALSEETAASLASLGVTRTVVIGGPLAVADAVLNDLPEPSRVWGEDRFGTSVATVEHGLAAGLSIDEVYLATGTDFPDALAAAPVAAAGEWGAKPGGMVLLVHGSSAERGSPDAHAWLATNAASVERVLVFGGPAAISEDVFDRVRSALS